MFFDAQLAPNGLNSQDFEVPGGAANLVVEAYPIGNVGSSPRADIQVLDAGAFGTLNNCADPNGVRTGATAYQKFQAKGVIERVAIQLTTYNGSAWSVWGTFTPAAADIARPDYSDRAPVNKTLSVDLVIAAGISLPLTRYTVPVNRKARAVVHTKIVAHTKPTTPGFAVLSVVYTPIGPPAAVMMQAEILPSAAGVTDQVGPTDLGVLLAGEILTFQNSDASSNDGTNHFIGFAKIFEYVA